jgi:DNA replication protein DnaC
MKDMEHIQSGVGEALSGIIQTSAAAIYDDTDQTDAEGYRICSVCGERKEISVPFPQITLGEDGENQTNMIPIKVPQPCACKRERFRKAREARERMQLENKRERLIPASEWRNATFDADDGRNARLTEVCKRYVEKYPELNKTPNNGMLLYGDTRGGKSFIAACIANALINNGFVPMMISVPSLLAELSVFDRDRQERMVNIQTHDGLVILDDMGAQRASEYAVEQLFRLVDGRSTATAPTIVTTNLTPEKMAQEQTLNLKRVYQRILEMCPVRLFVSSAAKRERQADRKELYDILGLERNES